MPDAPTAGGALPAVSVVIPTYNRPKFMREALASVIDQDYASDIDVLVVFDKSEPDRSLERDEPRRRVRTLSNARTSGLAGARNTGILGATRELVAFCDDDDTWLPGKLKAQVTALQAVAGSEFATTAMLVCQDDTRIPRLAHAGAISFGDLLRSRMSMLHSSSFLVRRAALLNGIGLVNESLPRSMAEDWELLLRASRRQPIVNVDRPLVAVRWGATSYYADQWALRNDAQLWLMEHYPEMLEDPAAAGMCYGKLAFGAAAQGHRAAALRWAGRAFRANRRELRTYIALGVALKIISASYVLRRLSRRGHGI